MTRKILLALGALLAAIVLFQCFLRYQYVGAGARVTRIDRLTGASCILPCARAVPASTETPGDATDVDARLVDYMRTTFDLSHPEDNAHEWKIVDHYDDQGNREQGLTLDQVKALPKGLTPIRRDAASDEQRYSIRIVCFCDASNVGDYYEVRPTQYGSFSAMEITGNSVLEGKYGLSRIPPPPPGYASPPPGYTTEPRRSFDPSTARAVKASPTPGFVPDATP